MGQATLMYGIGATKAGSSWLYRYLDGHPDCAMPVPKELHYFDRLEFGADSAGLATLNAHIEELDQQIDMLDFAQQLAQRRSGEIRDADPKLDIKETRLRKRLARQVAWRDVLQSDTTAPDQYLEFLYQDGVDAALVGDITPAYALLPEARLRQMAEVGPVTRFVYILRDPVERLWSNIRMVASQRSGEGQDVAPVAEALVGALENGSETQIMARSDYAGTLARLDRAVPETALFTGFFEQLFTPAGLKQLCKFLGISYVPGAIDKVVHEGIDLPLLPRIKDRLRRMLAPQYTAMGARFTTLPDAWHDNMVKV